MAVRWVYHDGALVRDWLDRLEVMAVGPHHSIRAKFNLVRTLATAELTYSSGILPSATIPMSADDFDPDRSALRVDTRWIPVTAKATEAITQWRSLSSEFWGKAQPLLFSSINGHDKAVPAFQHTHSFRVVGDAIGYRLTAMEIRATFIVEMRDRGMPIEQLAYITGMSVDNLLMWRAK